MNPRLTVQPSDFIKDFSPDRKADLHIHLLDNQAWYDRLPFFDKAQQLLSFLWIRYVSNPNDKEAEFAWRTIDASKNLSVDSLAHYLEKRFEDDHLRKFEYAFYARCLFELGMKKGTIVDVGGGYSYSTVIPMLFRFPKVRIVSLDVANYSKISKYAVTYRKGNCMNTNLAQSSVDLVSLISTLEHVGLGRYGDEIAVDGDILSMKEMLRILKPGGYVVLTIPYGYPTVVYNLHRVYDIGRLSKVTQGFKTIKAEYTLHGKKSTRRMVEGKKVTKTIPGYYKGITHRHPDPQGGVMLLLQKPL